IADQILGNTGSHIVPSPSLKDSESSPVPVTRKRNSPLPSEVYQSSSPEERIDLDIHPYSPITRAAPIPTFTPARPTVSQLETSVGMTPGLASALQEHDRSQGASDDFTPVPGTPRKTSYVPRKASTHEPMSESEIAAANTEHSKALLTIHEQSPRLPIPSPLDTTGYGRVTIIPSNPQTTEGFGRTSLAGSLDPPKPSSLGTSKVLGSKLTSHFGSSTSDKPPSLSLVGQEPGLSANYVAPATVAKAPALSSSVGPRLQALMKSTSESKPVETPSHSTLPGIFGKPVKPAHTFGSSPSDDSDSPTRHEHSRHRTRLEDNSPPITSEQRTQMGMSRLSQQLGTDKSRIDPYTGQPLGPIVSTITIQDTEASQSYPQRPPSARTVGYPPHTQEHTVVRPVVYQEGAPAPPLGEKTDYRPSA
ncbi:hypothetical protein FRC11_012602, partial [Ceratobasidium sp. 423]